MTRWPVQQEQVRERLQYRLLVLSAFGSDGETFPRVLVDDGQHAERSAIVRSVHDEVVGPDVVPVLRAMTNTRPVIEPQTAPLRLFLRYFQPLATPDALHPFVVDLPAVMSKQRGDAPITVTAVLAGQIDNRPCQGILVIARHERAALRRPRLSQHLASPPLGDCQRLLHVANRLPASFGA